MYERQEATTTTTATATTTATTTTTTPATTTTTSTTTTTTATTTTTTQGLSTNTVNLWGPEDFCLYSRGTWTLLHGQGLSTSGLGV